ncbi:hypothetical protein [Argonema galeatum]|uniref:hypothetical protein n=1 Tax=Argonema galeatum TaxID=2942762 RepID=UPI002011E8D6|nr:hypothetical protein [Argonema galeatum]MCL1465724.1 hypothetical protein [Argonema galeatum A003/A1]
MSDIHTSPEAQAYQAAFSMPTNLGAMIGTAIGGPIGGTVGGVLGAVVGLSMVWHIASSNSHG